MDLTRINKFQLMKLVDGTIMNKEVVKSSISNKVFDNAPIILTDVQSTYDIFKREQVVGFVVPNTTNIDNEYVVADVMLFKDIKNKTRYDNWMVRINDDQSCFLNYSCELYDDLKT